MRYFFEKILKPYIIENKYTEICEIGAREGGNTGNLLSIDLTRISVIDPCLDADLVGEYKNTTRVEVFKGLSLEILPKILKRFDCVLIDGDHNWYTVFNELAAIENRDLIKEGGTIFLHDIGWPYGRRDMYYLPDSIPAGYRHPYEKKGISRYRSVLSGRAAFNSHLNNAVRQGGKRNGVMTAVEDFLKVHGKKYLFFAVDGGRGLGVLIKKKDNATVLKYFKWFLKTRCYGYRPL